MTRPGALAAGGLVAVLAVVGCTPSGPGAEAGPTPTVRPTPTERPAPTDEPDPARARAPITIAVAGDVHFEGVLGDRLRRPATALAPATRTLAAADLAILNLETSLGTGGRPEPGKRFVFQAPTSALAALAAAGVDVASMANNHALDFGREPLGGTLAALDRARRADPPLDVVGLGRDADAAYAPSERRVGDTVVATLAATAADLDPTADPTGRWAATASSPGTADAVDPARLVRAVRAAARRADVVVVYLHWGVQGERCPSDAQRSLAEDVVAAGGDVVVGSHAHLVQGDGRLGPGYVAYGLGNYAWYTPSAAGTPVAGVLTLTVRPPASPVGRARVVRSVWEGSRIGGDGLPVPLAGPAAAEFDADVRSLRACAGLGRP